MKKLTITLFLCGLLMTSCNTFGTDHKSRVADNTKVVENIKAWKRAKGQKKLELSFQLALKYAKMAQTKPELIVTDTEEVEGDYVKRKYIIKVEDMEYEIWIVSKKERIITVWKTIALLASAAWGYVAAPGGAKAVILFFAL